MTKVSWFEVYLHVAPLLAEVAPWPAAGTPDWQLLSDHDPRKLAAVLEAGVHRVLLLECEQSERGRALAEASQAIAGSADWSAVARRVQYGPGDSYIPRKAS